MSREQILRPLAHLRKGWRVLTFRGWQEFQLGWLRWRGGWLALATRSAHLARRESTQWLDSLRQAGGLVPPGGLAAFRAWAGARPAWCSRLEQRVEQMAAGRFEIFDQSAAFRLERMPWSEDWRFGRSWPPAYFRSYRFYESDKPAPYDVKWPWELSRLGWLLPLAQAQALGGGVHRELAERLVADWETLNPLAGSVSWMPMEASVRAINLAISGSLLAADPETTPAQAEVWLRLLLLHGEFVSRVVEWTDVNNNHYVANLAALGILGRCLTRVHPSAARWHRFGEARLWREVLTQFHPDGVNYEMATGYHRLVTELCLLTALAAERGGGEVPRAVRERLAAATRYAAALVRPDGWAPAVGDNDSSRVLDFDHRHTRDFSETIALGAAFTGVSVPGPAVESAVLPWLLGADARRVSGSTPAWGISDFPRGGVTIVRSRGNYLFLDLGEVGLRGRGGHGHNDALGFELSIGGRPVLVDPGTSCYTGDLARHRQARSTASHNVLRIDGVEQAPLTGPWGIGNESAVRGRSVHEVGGTVITSAEHAGYARLPDPVVHRRRWEFEPEMGRLRVVDHLTCRGAHRAERFLHLPPGSRASVGVNCATVVLPGGDPVRISWATGTTARVDGGWVADSYGSERPAPVLVLEDGVTGGTELEFVVESAVPTSPA